MSLFLMRLRDLPLGVFSINQDEKTLFFDGDRLSGCGNDVLFQEFEYFLTTVNH
jgi:hypothetical protein